MTIAVALLSAILGLVLGALWRECYEMLKRIQKASMVLVQRADKQQRDEKKMTFADPVKWDELDDQERIDLLN